mmetsp:Transcript_10674/g.23737  ORF Transcript_10674/g.23737 Transcript_10674/m.23737 type:complete len:155 (-) Transcript_10674:116-580(-)
MSPRHKTKKQSRWIPQHRPRKCPLRTNQPSNQEQPRVAAVPNAASCPRTITALFIPRFLVLFNLLEQRQQQQQQQQQQLTLTTTAAAMRLPSRTSSRHVFCTCSFGNNDWILFFPERVGGLGNGRLLLVVVVPLAKVRFPYTKPRPNNLSRRKK